MKSNTSTNKLTFIDRLKRKWKRMTRQRARSSFAKAEKQLGQQQFVAELQTCHDVGAIVGSIGDYNSRRSLEAGKVVRDSNRVLLFEYVLSIVKNCQEGDYAEVGTYRGLTSSLVWARMADNCSLHCFDTFEGFAEIDLKNEKSDIDTESEKRKFKNTSIDQVTKTIAGGPNPNLFLHKGYFPETFVGFENAKFRFVHLDVDLYDPIVSGLEIFWPKLVPGGAVLVHDYLSPQYPGVKDAVDSYFEPLGITPVPWCDRLGTALILKNTKDG